MRDAKTRENDAEGSGSGEGTRDTVDWEWTEMPVSYQPCPPYVLHPLSRINLSPLYITPTRYSLPTVPRTSGRNERNEKWVTEENERNMTSNDDPRPGMTEDGPLSRIATLH